MDPTANLAEQVRLAAQLIDSEDPPELVQQRMERLAELVSALHVWIVRGGFLPDQWRAAVPNLARMVEAATSHLTGDDAERLEGDRTNQVPFDKIDQGFLIYVCSDEKTRRESAEGMSPTFAGLLDYTAAHGCRWLKLDADASEIPNLPTFEW